MIAELKLITGSASSSLPTSSRDVMYRIKLNIEVVKCIGDFECIAYKTDTGFILMKNRYGVDSFTIRPSKITATYTLNIPKRLVDTWNDLGEYEIEFDYENNCVELIKV